MKLKIGSRNRKIGVETGKSASPIGKKDVQIAETQRDRDVKIAINN